MIITPLCLRHGPAMRRRVRMRENLRRMAGRSAGRDRGGCPGPNRGRCKNALVQLARRRAFDPDPAIRHLAEDWQIAMEALAGLAGKAARGAS